MIAAEPEPAQTFTVHLPVPEGSRWQSTPCRCHGRRGRRRWRYSICASPWRNGQRSAALGGRDSAAGRDRSQHDGEPVFFILLKNDTCYACAVRCKRVVEDKELGVEGRYGGPEYENLATLGSYCMVSDLDRVALANQICNQEGMDPIAVGATIGWAMDAFAKGEITLADTGGMPILWGDAETMVKLTEMIATREGFGDVLAEGMNGASRKLGGRGDDLITAVKGNALPAHMPQVKRSLALIYAVNPFGADHQSSEHDPGYAPDSDEESLRRLALLGLTDPQDPMNLSDEKVRFALITQQFYSLLDSASVCQFVYGPAWQLYGPDHLSRRAERGDRLEYLGRRAGRRRCAQADDAAALQRARGRGAQRGQAAEEAVQAADRRTLGRSARNRGADGAGTGSLLRDGWLGQGDRNADRGVAGPLRAGLGDQPRERTHCRTPADSICQRGRRRRSRGIGFAQGVLAPFRGWRSLRSLRG